MWLDVCICIFFALFGYFGWRKGFLRNILGFTSSVISFVSAIFLANPLANLLDVWFNLSSKLDFNSFLKGRLFNVLISAIAIYICVRFIFYLLSKFVKNVREDNRKFSRTDSILGMLLGFAKAFLSLCVLAASIYAMASVPFMGKQIDKVIESSHIGEFIYDVALKIVYPLFKSVAEAVGNSLFG